MPTTVGIPDELERMPQHYPCECGHVLAHRPRGESVNACEMVCIGCNTTVHYKYDHRRSLWVSTMETWQ